mgnify:CR=1 FL=1
MLYNVDSAQYRMAAAGCPVAEHTGTERTLVLPHQRFGTAESTIGQLGDSVVRVAVNTRELAS